MIRVLSYPSTQRNPYFRLFYGALEEHGVVVTYSDRIADHVTSGAPGSFDVLHLHWSIELNWRKPRDTTRSSMLKLLRWWRLLRAVKRSGARILWTVHELFPPEHGRWFDLLGYAVCARAADMCICHSESVRRTLTRRYRVAPERTLVFPIGSYAGVLPDPTGRALVRQRYQLTEASRLLVFFGDLRPRKGPEVAIRAAELLGPQYELIVAGDIASRLLKDWAETVRQRALPANVRLRFERLADQDLADLLAAADCVLLPYLDIAASSALSLSVAAGRAVVASDLPYFREVLSLEPNAGVLCKPGDAQDLAGSVKSFFAMQVEVRDAAARRLSAKLDWKRLVLPVVDWLWAESAGVRQRGQTPVSDISGAQNGEGT